MRVLLTGGSGMVGRNILESANGRGLDILAPGRRVLDLLDGGAVEGFLRRERPDVVVHAAGTVGGIAANIAEPARFLAENMRIGLNVVLGARAAGIRRLLNIGSSCMYPRNAENPLREEQVLAGELEPTNEGYALAKIACARLCEYVVREDPALAYRTVIPCNLYGRYDKFDPATAHMVPAAIRKVAEAIGAGRDEVEIWGDGQARREFMYAGDLAGFVLTALERFDDLPQTMNVGVGRDHTVDEYYGAVGEALGFRGRFVHDPSKPSGMRRKLVDIARMEAFGWRPATSLQDGIRATYEFYLSGVSR